MKSYLVCQHCILAALEHLPTLLWMTVSCLACLTWAGQNWGWEDYCVFDGSSAPYRMLVYHDTAPSVTFVTVAMKLLKTALLQHDAPFTKQRNPKNCIFPHLIFRRGPWAVFLVAVFVQRRCHPVEMRDNLRVCSRSYCVLCGPPACTEEMNPLHFTKAWTSLIGFGFVFTAVASLSRKCQMQLTRAPLELK